MTNLVKKQFQISKKNESLICDGSADSLMEDDSEEGQLLQHLKKFARNFLFVAPEAENMEIAGFNVISGLLDDFKFILELDSKTFSLLLVNPPKQLNIEQRLLHKLPSKYIEVYKSHLQKNMFPGLDRNFVEWCLRAHLIVDYISGMTDTYSLQIHKLFKGIDVK